MHCFMIEGCVRGSCLLWQAMGFVRRADSGICGLVFGYGPELDASIWHPIRDLGWGSSFTSMGLFGAGLVCDFGYTVGNGWFLLVHPVLVSDREYCLII